MSHAWNFSSPEGQLALDVFRDGSDLVIRSLVAGVNTDQVQIHVDGDLLTIRGKREMNDERNDDDWFYRECYWGAFSRSLILPVDVYSERAEAQVKDGVLEIRIPIRESKRAIPIRIKN